MDDDINGSIDIKTGDPIDIIEKQQTFYQLFGFGSHLIYDCYPSKESVKDKIKFWCSGLKEINKNRLVDIIWSQRSYRGNNELLMSPIAVFVVHDLSINGDHVTYPLNIKSKCFTAHPVFRIQKCSGSVVDANGQNKSCAIFVDEFGRVYQNWQDFLKNCRYADGLMVAPKSGIYNGSHTTDQVLLDIKWRSKGVTRAFDNGSSVVGLASAVVTGVALIPAVTVAPAVLAVAVGAGLTSAAYTSARSVYSLVDRKKHNQSIGLADSEARNAWLNVGTGIVSVGAAGATQVVARAARNGRNISTLARNSVRAVNVAAIAVNVGGCTNDGCSLIHILCVHGTFSTQHAMQLFFNLFLLRHSWTNFNEIKRIMANKNKSITLNEMSVSQNESFEKLVSYTQEISGSVLVVPLVRLLRNTLNDPKLILKVATSEDWLKSLISTMLRRIAREYWRDFEEYFNTMLRKLGQKWNLQKLSMDLLNSVLRPLINLLREITFTTWNKIVQALEELVNELPNKIKQRYLKMFCSKLKQRSAIEGTELNDYISSKSDDELREFFNEEKRNVEKLENQTDKTHDEAYGSDNDGDDLDGDRKLELLIDQYASEYTEELEKCSPAAKTNDLYEIIVQILTKLPPAQAKNSFAIAKQLITAHAQDIQKSLGRFISVDIFVLDIHRLLSKRRQGFCTTLSDYFLDDHLRAEIENEFKQIYAVKIDPTLKQICCSTCGGNVFANK